MKVAIEQLPRYFKDNVWFFMYLIFVLMIIIYFEVFLFPGLRESIQGSSEGIKIRIEEVARDKEQHQQKDVKIIWAKYFFRDLSSSSQTWYKEWK